MSRLTAIIVFLITISHLNAQNVGVGTTSPAYKLDVAGRLRLQHTTNNTAGLWLDGLTLPTRSFIGTFSDDYMGIYGNAGAGWNFVMNVANGNVGIGTTAPAYKLDLKGRLRIQDDVNSAGIWLDGTTLPIRSFIGTYTDDYVGFYGSGGAGWNFVMNVNNGNTGIGTSSPTSKLDVNGTFRLRSNTPVKGSILTSTDNNGNAIWANPITFKGDGCLNGVPLLISNITWTKVMFHQSPAYNLGNAYQPNVSEFVAPVDGIYHFETVVDFYESADKQSIRIRMKRNGVTSTIGEIYNQGFIAGVNTQGRFDDSANVAADVKLLAGDIVWVEAYIDLSAVSGNDTNISENPAQTWFSGYLISRI